MMSRKQYASETRGRSSGYNEDGEEGIEKALNEFGLDVIATLMDSPISTAVALIGRYGI